MKRDGFTLIELIIVGTVVAILINVALSIENYTTNYNSEQRSYGFNGMTETRCISGYKFVVGGNGSAQQILNGSGHGIECDKQPDSIGK